jgi:hypothetical protein
MRFTNNVHQEHFENHGYVKIPLLNNEEISTLKEYILGNTPVVEMAEQNGFFQGVFIKDKKVKQDLSIFIKSTIGEKLDALIDEYKEIIYTALAKSSNENSQLALHQDASYVDENVDYSMSLWIPLSDSTLENGAIHILKESHKSFPTIRCATIIHDYGDSDEIKRKMDCIEVQAGEALLFHSRMLHYTPKNTTGETRIAVMSCLMSAKADILQWYKIEDTKLEVYKMKDDFFLNVGDLMLEKDNKPNGEKIGEVTIVPFNSELNALLQNQ